MYKVVVIGGGWSGCAAAVAARKAGAEVTLLEKTDMLLGLGNVGGIMRNNGRFTAAEENIALGARELFDITDRCARHTNVDFPGHKHASLYDVVKVEPQVRRLLQDLGVEIRLITRAIDVEKRGEGSAAVDSIVLADGEKVEGDVFVETTGSTGPCCDTQGLISAEVDLGHFQRDRRVSIIKVTAPFKKGCRCRGVKDPLIYTGGAL